MTTGKKIKTLNFAPHWRVQLILRGGGVINMISQTEPVPEYWEVYEPRKGKREQLFKMGFDPLENTEYGDTIGFIDLKEVAALTWRFVHAHI